MSEITVPLSKPVTAHGEELSVLTLREPVPEDLMQLGSPMLMIPSADGDLGLDVRPKVVAAYISRLAGIPMSSVKALSIADFMACQGALLPFLQGGGT